MTHPSKSNKNMFFPLGSDDSSNDISESAFSDSRKKQVSPGFSAEVIQKKKELLSPEPLSSIDNLEKELIPRKNYIGPGIWLDLIRGNEAEKTLLTQKKEIL